MSIKNIYKRIGAFLLLVLILSCRSATSTDSYQHEQTTSSGSDANKDKHFPETFEVGNKGGYAPELIALKTGAWYLDNALIGNSDRDQKDGRGSVRLKGGGRITMKFDILDEIKSLSVEHGLYGNETSGGWTLWYSLDQGRSWNAGSVVFKTSKEWKSETILVGKKGPIRFEIRAADGGRINIDNIDVVTANGGHPSTVTTNTNNAKGTDDNMSTGNPSGANTQSNNKDNFLIVHPQYCLSYNNSKGHPNWVSWHLSSEWLGTTPRCNCFFSDTLLPRNFRRVMTSDYTGSGFTRGHLCPSEDRSDTGPDNAATFFMSNVIPQAPLLNQETWEHLESYCRKLARKGNELYIIAGSYGSGGENNNGTLVRKIAGFIDVPSHFWKIIVVLPQGDNDMQRITEQTRVIAVDMPNTQTVIKDNWGIYRTTVDALENATGYDFLNVLPKSIQDAIEQKIDKGGIR